MASPSSSSHDTDSIDISTTSVETVDTLTKTIEEYAVEYTNKILRDILPVNIGFADMITNLVQDTETHLTIIHPLRELVYTTPFSSERKRLNFTMDITLQVYRRVVEILNTVEYLRCNLDKCTITQSEKTISFDAFVITVDKSAPIPVGDSDENLSDISKILRESAKARTSFNNQVQEMIDDHVEILADSIIPFLIKDHEIYPKLVEKTETGFIIRYPTFGGQGSEKNPFEIKIFSKTNDEEPKQIAVMDGTKLVYEGVVKNLNERSGTKCVLSSHSLDDKEVEVLEVTVGY